MIPRGESRKLSKVITTLVLAGLMSVLLSRPARSTDFNVDIFSGYDSFIDRYTIVDEDTFDVVNDYYLGFGAGIIATGKKNRLDLRNRFKYGRQAVDESIELLLAFRPSVKTGLDLRNSFTLKHFQPGSDYAFSNNYSQINSSIKLKRKVGKNVLTAVSGRLEALRYAEKTEFDYDYNYMDLGLNLEYELEGTGFFGIAAFLGRKTAPDTTELSYDRMLGTVESSIPLGKLTVRLATSMDRKEYSGTVRSPYWYIISNLEATLNEMKKSSYSLIVDSEVTSYDEESEIYINTLFLRVGMKYKYEMGNLSSLYLEPRLARMFCASSPEERYLEGSVVIGIDIFDYRWFWLTASYEPGYRDYLLEDNSIYSDFTINRLSLIGSIHLSHGFSIDTFLSHEPEKHSRREDNFSVSLISVELKKSL